LNFGANGAFRHALEMTKRMIIQKTRWIRTYDTSRAAIVEIPLQADEKPLDLLHNLLLTPV
jgi:hypothetical protein